MGHHYSHTNTNNVNKTWALLQTTGGKDEHNIVFMQKTQHRTQNVHGHIIGQHRKLKIWATQTSPKNRGELRCNNIHKKINLFVYLFTFFPDFCIGSLLIFKLVLNTIAQTLLHIMWHDTIFMSLTAHNFFYINIQ